MAGADTVRAVGGSGSLLRPNERVLSTLNADGSRRWLNPKVVAGPIYRARRVIGFVLIAIFVTLPHLHAGGKQLFFVDIASGELTLFGMTFVRTDTLLLALGGVSVFLTVFFATAMFGRVWCGWMCPQTVYLDFLFRPIDRLFDGKRNKKGLGAAVSSLGPGSRGVLRFAVMLVCCFVLANTFLGYFVGSRNLLTWITDWPWVHPMGFGIVAFVTAAMMVDFGFYREQLCFVACPYGRIQSVMLDKRSLIVGYDAARGEPRRTARGRGGPGGHLGGGDAVSLRVLSNVGDGADGGRGGGPGDGTGDCVGCNKCVQVCPSGIDIRDGLQLECIHCAACIDACNGVMEKLGRAPGLVRYTSQEELETGKRRWFRPRVAVYPAVLTGLVIAISAIIITKSPADVQLVRDAGLPFNVLPSGEVANQMRVRICNRTDETQTYTLSSASFEGQAELRVPGGAFTVEPGETLSQRVLVVAKPEVFAAGSGRAMLDVVVSDGEAFETVKQYRMLGPVPRDVPVVSGG
ncbi:MAG: 4Fe-4S dicluster domain-containing protein [Planctomycetota bacterium]